MTNIKQNPFKATVRIFLAALSVGIMSFSTVFAQTSEADQETAKTAEKNAKQEKNKDKLKFDKNAPLNAEQIAELVIVVYGSRAGLNQLRRTELERGKIVRLREDGTNDDISYELRRIRGVSMLKDRLKLDYKSAAVEYSLFLNNEELYGVLSSTRFQPRPDIISNFDAMFWNGLESLLRYKENGSTLNLIGKDKQLGVEFYILELTDPKGHKTKYNISTKTFRVLALDYDQKPTGDTTAVKYVRRFYDYRPAQGTLVPYRSVLFANNKQVEETTVSTITYGIKIDDEIFKTGNQL